MASSTVYSMQGKLLLLATLLMPLTIEAVAGQGKYKLYVPDKEQRILAEAKGQQLLFLRASHYALFNGQFVELETAVSENANNWQPPAIRIRSLAAPKATPSATAQAPLCQIRRVFLDPGHGGSDLGTSFSGVFEKNLSLSFAQKAEKELKALGFQVILSRSRDVFLPLDIRPELAKEWKADVFISIHMNSSPSKAAHGTETYILSADATDAEARKLALRENSKPSSAQKGQNPLSDILWDMQQTVYLQESAYLASAIQQSTSAAARSLVAAGVAWKNRGVRQAPFFVLSRAAMPAILLELGYLSNQGDRRFLLSREFQEKLAKSFASGVKSYAEACKFRNK